MNEKVKNVQFGLSKKIKGHVKIELRDAETGKLKYEEEGDNLVTNALASLVNIIASANKSYLDDLLMPVATRALGGLMMFDAPLTEDAGNIHFPSNQANLSGFGLQSVNSSNGSQGSINNSESGKTSSGYIKVWDFGTSQANGIINSLALTSHLNTPFYHNTSCEMHNIMAADGSDYWHDCCPVYYDGEYLYFMRSNRTGSSGSYTTTLTIYKERIPLVKFKVADTFNVRDYPEVVTTVTFDSTSYNPDIHAWHAGYDGYAYCVYASGSTVRYLRIKTDDLSFEISDGWQSFDVTGITFQSTWHKCCKGYFYVGSSSRQVIYKINISNLTDVSSIALPEGYYLENMRQDYNMHNMRNGGVMFAMYCAASSGASGYYDHYRMILTHLGVLVKQLTITSTNSYTYYYFNAEGKFICEEFPFYWGTRSDNTFVNSIYEYSGHITSNFLGTIYNLAAPIVKNATETLKITYTLTDIEEENNQEP